MQTYWTSTLGALATFLAAGITAAATLVGTMVALFFSWYKERGESAKRSQIIKEATDSVLFWKAWQELGVATANPDDLDGIRAKVREELDSIRAGFERRIHIPVRPDSWIRRMLLLYRPYNDVVWFLRSLFYALLIFAIPFGVIVGEICFKLQFDAIDQFTPMILKPNQPTPERFTWDYIEHSLNIPAVAGVLTLVCVLGFLWILLVSIYVITTLFVRWTALDLDKDPLSEQVHEWLFYIKSYFHKDESTETVSLSEGEK